MTKYILLLSSFLLYLNDASSQSLRSYVISTYGESLTHNDGSMYVSIGEPLNTEIEEDGTMIAQGFLQVTIIGITVATEETLDFDLKVFPNPVNQYLNIELPTIPNSPTEYVIRDQTGRLVATTPVTDRSTQIDFKWVNTGNYYLQLRSGNLKSKVVKIQKINQ